MHPFCNIKKWIFNINDRISNIEKCITIFKNSFFLYITKYIEFLILEIQLKYYKKILLISNIVNLILIKLMSFIFFILVKEFLILKWIWVIF